MTRHITVTESVLVNRSREDVWDFTQDYTRRASWDASVLNATVLSSNPVPRIQVGGAGGLNAVFQYRQFNRPSQTSLQLEEVRSFLIQGGGGSWSYESKDGHTHWTQTNTLIVKSGWWLGLFVPLVRRQLLTSTRRAMRNAKRMLESASVK